MTPEELLIPRFKCIAPLPFQPEKDMYKVGDIFTDDGKTVAKNQNRDPVYSVVWQEYPHLFKPLQWYEDRAPKDMPEYVKYKSENVWKVIEHTPDGCRLQGSLEGGFWARYKNLHPATKEEYESYLKEKEAAK